MRYVTAAIEVERQLMHRFEVVLLPPTAAASPPVRISRGEALRIDDKTRSGLSVVGSYFIHSARKHELRATEADRRCRSPRGMGRRWVWLFDGINGDSDDPADCADPSEGSIVAVPRPGAPPGVVDVHLNRCVVTITRAACVRLDLAAPQSAVQPSQRWFGTFTVERQELSPALGKWLAHACAAFAWGLPIPVVPFPVAADCNNNVRSAGFEVVTHVAAKVMREYVPA